MPRKQESKWNLQLQEPSDGDVYTAIRYPDPDAGVATNREDDKAPIVICVSLLVLLS